MMRDRPYHLIKKSPILTITEPFNGGAGTVSRRVSYNFNFQKFLRLTIVPWVLRVFHLQPSDIVLEKQGNGSKVRVGRDARLRPRDE